MKATLEIYLPGVAATYYVPAVQALDEFRRITEYQVSKGRDVLLAVLRAEGLEWEWNG